MATGALHEDPAHGFSGGGKEMSPGVKLEMFRAPQPQVGFVNQRRRLQRVTGPLGRHFEGRDRPQFGINLIIKLIQGIGISPGGLPEKFGQLAHVI